MQNQIYRLSMSDNKQLEFYVCDTNELEPYKKTKEMAVMLIGKDLQIDGSLPLDELSSLISFLEECKDYVRKFNAESKPDNK